MRFKRIIAGCVAAATVVTAAAGVTACKPEEESNVPEWQQDGALKILCIGNSYSDDMTQWSYRIAKAMGVEEAVIGNLFIGGCSLDMHLNNAKNDAPAYEYRLNKTGTWENNPNYKMSDALKSENWDFITFQYGSATSQVYEAVTYAALPELITYVRSLAGDTPKLAWHLTWTDSSISERPVFDYFNRDETAMYNKIIDMAKTEVLAKNDQIEYVIPNGTAIQNARTSFMGDTFNRDGYHLNMVYGRYLAGLGLIATLTGLPFDDLKYSPMQGNDAEAQREVCKEAVKNALAKPYEVTPSQYKTK